MGCFSSKEGPQAGSEEEDGWIHMFQKRISAFVQPIVIASVEHLTIQFANDAAVDTFGYSLDELLGKPVELLMMSGDAKQHCEYVRRYKLGKGGRLAPLLRPSMSPPLNARALAQGRIIDHKKGRRVVAKCKNGDALDVLLSISDPVKYDTTPL